MHRNPQPPTLSLDAEARAKLARRGDPAALPRQRDARLADVAAAAQPMPRHGAIAPDESVTAATPQPQPPPQHLFAPAAQVEALQAEVEALRELNAEFERIIDDEMGTGKLAGSYVAAKLHFLDTVAGGLLEAAADLAAAAGANAAETNYRRAAERAQRLERELAEALEAINQVGQANARLAAELKDARAQVERERNRKVGDLLDALSERAAAKSTETFSGATEGAETPGSPAPAGDLPFPADGGTALSDMPGSAAASIAPTPAPPAPKPDPTATR